MVEISKMSLLLYADTFLSDEPWLLHKEINVHFYLFLERINVFR